MNIFVLGDFNATPGSDNVYDIQQICGEHGMVLADVRMLPPPTLSHVNQGCLSCSLLDHVALSPFLYNVTSD